MFERYTERARRSLFFARYKAGQLGSHSIETEHMLLGVARAGEPLADWILSRARLSTEEIGRQIKARIGRDFSGTPVPDSVEISFSTDVKRVFEYAAEESDRLLHSHIGSEHLLLGLLRHDRGLAAEILKDQGLVLASVRDDIVMQLSATSPPPREIAGMLPGRRPPQRLADDYVMTAIDGTYPGRRITGDNVGFSDTFFNFTTRADKPPDGRIYSIGPISMSGTTLSAFAQVLENFLGRPVRDETGITGTCDIELRGEYDTPEALIAALRDQLGLLLTASL